MSLLSINKNLACLLYDKDSIKGKVTVLYKLGVSIMKEDGCFSNFFMCLSSAGNIVFTLISEKLIIEKENLMKVLIINE